MLDVVVPAAHSLRAGPRTAAARIMIIIVTTMLVAAVLAGKAPGAAAQGPQLLEGKASLPVYLSTGQLLKSSDSTCLPAHARLHMPA